MLSLPNDGRYPTLELAAQQRRQKTLEALTAQLEADVNERGYERDLKPDLFAAQRGRGGQWRG